MKGSANIIVWLVCMCAVLFSVSGCLWVPVPAPANYYVLEGQTVVKQADHSVILCGVDYRSPAKQFVLDFRVAGDPKTNTANLVAANYQYYSEDWQPLEVVSINPLAMKLIPKAKIVSKPSPKRTEKTGEIMHGRYKISVKYFFAGREYESDFSFLYNAKVEAGVVGPWSGKEIH